MANVEATAGHFPAWLRRELASKGWKQVEFAERLGMDKGIVGRWLRGERVPSPESCDRISDVLGVPLDEVLALAGHRPRDYDDGDGPAERLYSMLKRIDLTEERVMLIEAQIDRMRDIDRNKRSHGGA